MLEYSEMRGFDDLVAGLARDCPEVLMQVDLPAKLLRPFVPAVGRDDPALVENVRALTPLERLFLASVRLDAAQDAVLSAQERVQLALGRVVKTSTPSVAARVVDALGFRDVARLRQDALDELLAAQEDLRGKRQALEAAVELAEAAVDEAGELAAEQAVTDAGEDVAEAQAVVEAKAEIATRLVDLTDEEAAVIAEARDALDALAAANDNLTDTRTQAQQLVEEFADAASEPVQTAVEELSAQVAVAVPVQETGAEVIDDATQSLAGLDGTMEALVEAVTSQADPDA